MKVYGKDSGLWQEVKQAALAGLLCLPFYSAVAESITPATGRNMETVNSVPEGYRPLPVTMLEVNSEKSAGYTVTVSIEYPGKPSDAQEWLEKNFTGRIDIYKDIGSRLIVIDSHFVFHKKNSLLNTRASDIIPGKTFCGEQFSVKLERGDYIILPKLYSIGDSSQYTPHVYISFERVKHFWWY